MPNFGRLVGGWWVAIFAMAVAMAVWPAREAAAQSYMQNYENTTDDHGGSRQGNGVHIEVMDISAIVANDERGLHASLWFAGLGDFLFGVESTFFFQQRPTADERFLSARFAVGMNALELYEGAWIRLEAGLVVGERLIGKDDFAEFGLGVNLGLPIVTGPDGWPIFHANGSFSFSPIKGFDENFMIGGKLTLYLFPPGPLRPLGLSAGWYFGEDRNIPWAGIYIGLTFGAPIGHDH